MADDVQPNKSSSFVQGIKQKLIGELLGAADGSKNAAGETDSEKLQEKTRSILKRYDEETQSAELIFAQLKTDVAAVEAFADKAPYDLNDLLVSKEPWPFEDLSQLAGRFGALPQGYCYRYLAPETYVVPAEVANKANNVIRIPSALNLVVSKYFEASGDEIPYHSLGEWLEHQSAELYRLWTLRVLSHCGIVDRSALPTLKPRTGSVPSAGPKKEIPATIAQAAPQYAKATDPTIADLVDDFEEQAILHYGGEEREKYDDTFGGIYDKIDTYRALQNIGPHAILALSPLLNHPDVGVRVSAATYLLPSEPQIALPVLRQVIARGHVGEEQMRLRRAILHARQTIWMYEDGNLKLEK